jgi:hypothetical protein
MVQLVHAVRRPRLTDALIFGTVSFQQRHFAAHAAVAFALAAALALRRTVFFAGRLPPSSHSSPVTSVATHE